MNDEMTAGKGEEARDGKGVFGKGIKVAAVAALAFIAAPKALKYAKAYGPQLRRISKEYGPKVAELAKQYGPQAIALVKMYGPKALDMVKEYGPQAAEKAAELLTKVAR